MPILHRCDSDDAASAGRWRYDSSDEDNRPLKKTRSSRWRCPDTSDESESFEILFLNSKSFVSFFLDFFRGIILFFILWSLQLRHLEPGSGTDENQDDEEGECAVIDVSLTFAGLQSFHGCGSLDDATSCTYNANGMCPDRIKGVLKHPACPCGCTMPVKLLQNVCTAFWQLKKDVQDSILWSLQTAGGTGGNKRKYMIEGLDPTTI